MPYFGAHLSISDGYKTLFSEADRIGCEAVQIFAKNQRQWAHKPIDKESSKSFKEFRNSSSVKYMNIHASYLLNLASPDTNIQKKSAESLIDDLIRGAALGINDIVFHPGNHMGQGEVKGVELIAEGMNRVLNETENGILLLETTSGQGTSVGWRFEHIRDIISQIKNKNRVGVCYDTCHAFAAGYDIGSRESYEGTFTEFEKKVGLKKIVLFHLNDSKYEFNSKKDRHEFIGKGKIGAESFSILVNDVRFKKTPMILEIPGDYEDFKNEIENLKRLVEKK